MHTFVKILSIWATFSLSKAAPTPSEEFPYYVPLADQDRYHLFWKYDDSSITFEIHVKTMGYVSLGISKTGGMKDADTVIGWVNGPHAYVQDRYSYKEGAVPKMDKKSQDWVLLSGKETDTHTIMKIKRDITNCDPEDVDITLDTTKLIWAYHPREEPDSPDSDPPYHGSDNRGTRSIQLLTAKKPNPQLPSDAFSVDFINPNVSVPSDDTTYWCQGFSMPANIMGSKHHVVKVEPVIEEKNKAYVHHILIYGCFHTLDPSNHASWDVLHGQGDVCYTGAMPTDSCSSVLFAWAIGEEQFFYPDHVGFPLGGQDEKTLFLRMETHYDNPDLRNDIVDSSGLRLWVTPTTRQYDAGLVEVGVQVHPFHTIPPTLTDFRSMSYCPRQCMEAGLGNSSSEDIKMIAGFLHTHLLGSAIRLRHFRDGKELPPIYTDENYDFNFQEVRLLQQEIAVKSGGLGTKNEMCLAFMQYYPRRELMGCRSIPTMQQTLSFLSEDVSIKITNYPFYQITAPQKFVGKKIHNIMNEVAWGETELQQGYQNAVYSGQHFISCEGPNFNWMQEVEIPDYIKPMEKEKSSCDVTDDCPTCGASILSHAVTISLIVLIMT